MNGAHALARTLLDGGVDTCFANPGTSEMHFVAALDQLSGMRCVLGLFEGVVTGAADGFFRISEKPAATLLHLGPGLANGLANLHNAKKARSGIVNIIGEHAAGHLALDAPLTCDIATLATPMSHWVRTITSTQELVDTGREAIRRANGRPAEIASLILPADMAWSEVAPQRAMPSAATTTATLDEDALRAAVRALREDPSGTLLLLGGRAARTGSTHWAGRLSAATGCGLRCEFYVPRIERGAGRVPVPRLPYAVDAALEALAAYRRIILVDAKAPVAFFAYPGKPGLLTPPGCECITLCDASQDAEAALHALCEAVGAQRSMARIQEALAASAALEEGPLTPASIGNLIASLIPEGAIVVDEAISTGRAFDSATRGAAPHEWLTNMGGSIGYGLPVAVGAAIAAPGRKVIALEGDGSAMYTPQALWTLAREGLDVTVVVFANRSYQILKGEFAHVGAGAPGRRASDMLSIDRPAIDWVALGGGLGVPSCRVRTLGELADAMRRCMHAGGPGLIEVMMA